MVAPAPCHATQQSLRPARQSPCATVRGKFCGTSWVLDLPKRPTQGGFGAAEKFRDDSAKAVRRDGVERKLVLESELATCLWPFVLMFLVYGGLAAARGRTPGLVQWLTKATRPPNVAPEE